MRTKSLILGAALLAAGVASSMAQSNVYSLNVVGYVTLNLTNGLNLVANQLDLDGTGTNNLLVNVFSNSLPNSGTFVYKFSAGSFQTFNYGRGGWGGAGVSTATLNPGEACFVSLSAPASVTTVGQVLQGTWTNVNLSGSLSMLSSIFPLSGTIDGTGNGGLAYAPTTSDFVYLWDPVGQTYDTYGHGRGGWSPSDPIINVGAGFFLSSANTTWINSFTVQ